MTIHQLAEEYRSYGSVIPADDLAHMIDLCRSLGYTPAIEDRSRVDATPVFVVYQGDRVLTRQATAYTACVWLAGGE